MRDTFKFLGVCGAIVVTLFVVISTGNLALAAATALQTGNGGTGTTTWQTNSIPIFNGTNFSERNANFSFQASKGGFTVGTSTSQYGDITAGSSTAPQLLLSDNAPGDFLFSFRNAGGQLFIATSTATATSSAAALQIDTNGKSIFSISPQIKTIINALLLTDGSGNTAAYAGSNPCTNQVALSLSALGVISCTSITDAMFSGQLGLSHGGTNASLSGANQIPYLNAGNTALTLDTLFTRNAAAGTHLIGTTTPGFGSVTIGSSTAPQLTLVDNAIADLGLSFRVMTNLFAISTSTPTATSSVNILTINGLSGAVTFGSPGTTTASGGFQAAALNLTASATSTAADGFNIATGCYSVAGVCLTSGGSSFSGTTGQVDYFSGTNTAVGTSTITISTASNVGIATTSPFGVLAVAGPTLATTIASSSIWSVNGTFTYTTPTNTAFLVVQAWGAGGAGGITGNSDGGGGAGSFIASTTISAPASSYTLKIGQGGQNSTGGTGFQSGGNGQGGNGGGGGGSTGFGSTIIACGGGGGSDATGATNAGGGAGASGTSGGTGGTAPSGSGGGGGGCNTAGTSASSNSGGAGGTGGTSTSGTNGSGGSGSTSNANGGGGGSSAGVSGNGSTGTSATGGGGGAGASGSGGAAQGVAGTRADSGGGGRGSTNFSLAPTAGGNPGAGGGGCATGVGACTTSSNGADGKIIVYAFQYSVAMPLLVASFSTTTPGITLSNTSNGTAAFSVGTTTNRAILTIAASTFDTALSIWGNISGVGYLFQQIDSLGHLITGGPVPTCGTGCASIQGDDRNMRIITGSSVTTIVANFAGTYTKTPVCVANEESIGTVSTDASSTPTTVTVTTASALTTKFIVVHCEISNNFTF